MTDNKLKLAEAVRQMRRSLDLKPEKLVRHIPVRVLPPLPDKFRRTVPKDLTIAERKQWKRMTWYSPGHMVRYVLRGK